jgi:hypothetical protein
MATRKGKPPHIGQAQWDFILKTRAAIDNDASGFFRSNNWRSILPNGGTHQSNLLNTGTQKSSVESFYVKGIAAWVPHRLINNHIPSCPNCESNRNVDVVKSRWLTCPKVLFGLGSHRYLDTVLYPCVKCKKHFAGYNKKSMQVDAHVYFSYFNFFLSGGYAVDEQLYRYLVLHASTEATSIIARKLKAMAYEAYFDDYQLYLQAVGLEKIRPACKKRRTIASYLPRADNIHPSLVAATRKKNDLSGKLQRLRMECNGAKVRLEADYEFKHMLDDKDNHNVHGRGNKMKGLGSTKLRKLIAHGIISTKALLRATPASYPEFINKKRQSVIPAWKQIVKDFYKEREKEWTNLSKRVQEVEAEYKDVLEEVTEIANAMAEEYEAELQEGNGVSRRPPLFSKMEDKLCYNGRFLSKYRIDQVVSIAFHYRRAFQESKMMGLRATMLKIDYNYKLASKIHVWTGQGQSFPPYKCIITIHNEDGLTVFWKALKHSESLSEIGPDLLRLRERLNRINITFKSKQRLEAAKEVYAAEDFQAFLASKPSKKYFGPAEQAVKVCYVDNCCGVCISIKKLFPGCLVKLDAFHWMKRWNDIMFDCKSAEAGIFRGLIHKALFLVEATEYEEARQRLITHKKKTTPTVKEILREANSVIPPPDVLRRNVEAVFDYCNAKDAETERLLSLRRDDDTSPTPNRFFKNSAKNRDVIRNQFRHIDRGCLSDPPDTLVNIFRRNDETKVTYVARGTNTNERDNLDLAHSILAATHIGIDRAERLMANYFEEKNGSKAIRRLGEEDFGTHHTEKLLLLNSFAQSVGYSSHELPYVDVSAPSTSVVEEFLGFRNAASRSMLHPIDIADDEEAIEDAEDEEHEMSEVDHLALESTNNIIDDLDIEVFGTEEDYEDFVNNSSIISSERQLQLIEAAEAAKTSDERHRDQIQRELLRLIPETTGRRESTMQAFTRLTNRNVWVPFRLPNSAIAATEVDKEEESLFDEWMEARKYSVDVKTGPRSFKAFANDWNNEVSRRFSEWSKGDDSIVQIRLKSIALLQQFNEERKKQQRLQAASTDRDEERQRLNAVFRDSRAGLELRLPAHVVTPPVYVHNGGPVAFGNPVTLNATIAVAAVADITNAPFHGRINAPFRMTLPQLPKVPPPRPVTKHFRSKRYCIVCGWRKVEHTTEEGKGGRDKKGNVNCFRAFCGNCFRMASNHDDGVPFGPECTYPTNAFCTKNVAEWWEYRVR